MNTVSKDKQRIYNKLYDLAKAICNKSKYSWEVELIETDFVMYDFFQLYRESFNVKQHVNIINLDIVNNAIEYYTVEGKLPWNWIDQLEEIYKELQI